MRLLRCDLGYNSIQSSLSLQFSYSVDSKMQGLGKKRPTSRTWMWNWTDGLDYQIPHGAANGGYGIMVVSRRKLFSGASLSALGHLRLKQWLRGGYKMYKRLRGELPPSRDACWATSVYRLYSTILYYTILYYTILYYTILYYTILYYTILYYTKILYINSN